MLNLRQRISAAWSIIKRGSIAPFDRVGSDVGSPDRLLQPFANSVWVHAAIRHISIPIGSVSLEHSTAAPGGRGLVRRSRSIATRGQDTLDSDPRLDAFWASPAIGLSSLTEFIGALVGWRKLAGEAFLLLGDDVSVPFPEARSAPMSKLVVARPDRMRHVVRDGLIVGWEFTDGQGRRHALLPEQVIHLKQWNPYNEHRGLGEYEAARIAAETDHASATFARNLAASQGDQGVYVVAKGGVMDQSQRDQITATLAEKRRLQQRGIFRPVFLTGDITVEDPQVRSVDAAFIAQRQATAAEIFVAFGVPPSMSKEQASYSIGGASDYFRLISDTCIPESARLAEAVSRISSLILGREVWASWCWDEHPVMQAVRRERMASVDVLWAKGMPMRAVSEYLDLDLPRFAGDDEGWLPLSVVPAGQAADPMPDPGPEGATPAPSDSSGLSDTSDPVQAAIHALRSGPVAVHPPAARASAADLQLWRRHMRQRQPTVKAYEAGFTRALITARAQMLRKIEQRYRPTKALGASTAGDLHASAPVTRISDFGAPQAAAERCGGDTDTASTVRSGAVDLMFDAEEFSGALVLGFRKVSKEALDQAGRQVFTELGKDDPFTYPPARAVQFIQSRENRIKDMAADVFESLKSTIQEGMNSGDSIKELSDRVRAKCNDMSRGRAKRIAMTETAAAYGTARQEAMREAGVSYKRWLNSGGDNVRPAHIDANNQTVPVDEAFDVGGEQLMHPGDPSGRPDNVINCHCVSVAVVTPDEGLNTDAPTNA